MTAGIKDAIGAGHVPHVYMLGSEGMPQCDVCLFAPCAVCWLTTNAAEAGTRIRELLSTASSKGISGKNLMAAAVASLQAPAEASAALPREDKLLVGVRGLPCLVGYHLYCMFTVWIGYRRSLCAGFLPIASCF